MVNNENDNEIILNNIENKHLDLRIHKTFNFFGKEKFLHVVLGDNHREYNRYYYDNKKIKRNRIIIHFIVYLLLSLLLILAINFVFWLFSISIPTILIDFIVNAINYFF